VPSKGVRLFSIKSSSGNTLDRDWSF